MALEILANAGWGPHEGPGLIIGPIVLFLLAALIATVIWLVVRSARPSGPSGPERARTVLAERFARGELSPEEYRDRLSHLREAG